MRRKQEKFNKIVKDKHQLWCRKKLACCESQSQTKPKPNANLQLRQNNWIALIWSWAKSLCFLQQVYFRGQILGVSRRFKPYLAFAFLLHGSKINSPTGLFESEGTK